jgi:hypothetical protein
VVLIFLPMVTSSVISSMARRRRVLPTPSCTTVRDVLTDPLQCSGPFPATTRTAQPTASERHIDQY